MTSLTYHINKGSFFKANKQRPEGIDPSTSLRGHELGRFYVGILSNACQDYKNAK